MRNKFLLLLILAFGCNKDEVNSIPSILTDLEGMWQFELGVLDFAEVESWMSTSMIVVIKTDSSIQITCSGQPTNRTKIWPAESNLVLQDSSQGGRFLRDDGIDIYIQFDDDSLVISMHPPREWSYEEACPNDENQLVCSEGGMWQFTLN